MLNTIYKKSIITKPKFTLLVLLILLASFGYFAKKFQLDASSDTLLLENAQWVSGKLGNLDDQLYYLDQLEFLKVKHYEKI